MRKQSPQAKLTGLTAAEIATLRNELHNTSMDLRTYVSTTKNTAIAFKLLKANAKALALTI